MSSLRNMHVPGSSKWLRSGSRKHGSYSSERAVVSSDSTKGLVGYTGDEYTGNTRNVVVMFNYHFTSRPAFRGKFSHECNRRSLSSSATTSWVPGCFHSNQPTSCFILYCSRAAGPHRKGLEVD